MLPERQVNVDVGGIRGKLPWARNASALCRSKTFRPADRDVRARSAPENAFGSKPPRQRPKRVASVTRNCEVEPGDRRHRPYDAASVNRGVDACPRADHAEGPEPRDDVLR